MNRNEKGQASDIFGALGCGVLAVVAIIALVIGGWAIKYYTADVRGKIDANETIKSGNNRIAQYDKFFNACSSIKSLESKIDASTSELAQADPSDRGRLLSNISGQLGARAEAINNYNADANKSYTNGQFRSSNLPAQIPLTEYVAGGKKTLCTAD